MSCNNFAPASVVSVEIFQDPARGAEARTGLRGGTGHTDPG